MRPAGTVRGSPTHPQPPGSGRPRAEGTRMRAVSRELCPKERARAERLRRRRRTEAREGKARRYAERIKMGTGFGWGATTYRRLYSAVGEPRLECERSRVSWTRLWVGRCGLTRMYLTDRRSCVGIVSQSRPQRRNRTERHEFDNPHLLNTTGLLLDVSNHTPDFLSGLSSALIILVVCGDLLYRFSDGPGRRL